MDPLVLTALRGQTALITGAAHRLGAALAEGLAANGVHVVLHYNTRKGPAEALAQRLQASHGVSCWTVQANLSSADEAARLIEKALTCSEKFDILINNASIFEESSIQDVSEAELLRNMQVNAWAPLTLAQHFAKQAQQGTILNMLDTKVLEYDKDHAAYHLSKRALQSINRMLAMELAPNIRVNAIAPGLVLAPEGKDEAYLEALAPTVPLQGYSHPTAIVEAALFLLKNAFITGQCIYVDGGRHLHGSFYD